LARLGELAFLDTETIDEGNQFPFRLLDGLLDARVVVIDATKTYSEFAMTSNFGRHQD
jgi:hypothetical protein